MSKMRAGKSMEGFLNVGMQSNKMNMMQRG